MGENKELLVCSKLFNAEYTWQMYVFQSFDKSDF